MTLKSRRLFLKSMILSFLFGFISILNISVSHARPECPSTYPSLCIGEALSSGGGGGGLCNGRPCQGALRLSQP